MMQEAFIFLPHRGILEISGEDRFVFLQNLVSNDVTLLKSEPALHAALLTPQGRFLHEFFIVKQGDLFLLDAEKDRIDDLIKKFSLYKLRSKIFFKKREDLSVFASLQEESPFAEGMAYEDPRNQALGFRCIISKDYENKAKGSFEEWDLKRISLKIPDGSRDLEIEKALLMENNFEEMKSVDFKKGCYIGQELTARMKWRALVKKKLVNISFEGQAPVLGARIFFQEEEIGEMRSYCQNKGLALMRLEALEKEQPFLCDGTRIFLDSVS